MLGLALFLLSACGPQAPIQITDLSVDGEPWVGEVVTLHIEVKSMFDETDTTIEVRLPKGVKLIEGDLSWQGSLTANQVQAHELSLCVLYEGDWRILVRSRSQHSETSSYTNSETMHLITSAESARAVPGWEYRYTQPTGGHPPNTHLPETTTQVCP